MSTETNPARAALTDTEAAAEARRIITDFATSFRDDAPIPTIGTAPPIPQPGRPPMSSKATDASVMMIAGGFLSLCLGGAVSMVLYFTSKADPTVIVSICAAPPAAFLALKGLVKGVKSATVPDIHNYSGPVTQHHRTTNSRSVWAKTINKP